jgi:hypothetical protein
VSCGLRLSLLYADWDLQRSRLGIAFLRNAHLIPATLPPLLYVVSDTSAVVSTPLASTLAIHSRFLLIAMSIAFLRDELAVIPVVHRIPVTESLLSFFYTTGWCIRCRSDSERGAVDSTYFIVLAQHLSATSEVGCLGYGSQLRPSRFSTLSSTCLVLRPTAG